LCVAAGHQSYGSDVTRFGSLIAISTRMNGMKIGRKRFDLSDLTFVGQRPGNPNWAILKHDGQALYWVRETKGT
jgi:hypothetical protein